MRSRKKYTLVAALILTCCAVAFEPVPLTDLIKESDVVVVGKLEITRENGLVVTWYPEMRDQQKETTHFHIGRIRASKVLYKRERDERNYDVAFDSSWHMTNGMQSIWLLRWNSLLGRYALSQPYPNTLPDVEKAIAEVRKDEKR
jgi:hypothetical protein